MLVGRSRKGDRLIQAFDGIATLASDDIAGVDRVHVVGESCPIKIFLSNYTVRQPTLRRGSPAFGFEGGSDDSCSANA
jgi:hypothetical protein